MKIFENRYNKYIYDASLESLEPKSHRHKDDNGRLLVDKTLITKSCVNDYYGKEIPNYEELGLEPLTKYKVLRPAEELKKSLALFNNIPILNKHIMDYADEPRKENRCGGLSNCIFEDNAVYADLNIWDKSDIERIENGELKDLSCGYRCNFVKESGEYDGEHYDLKMVDIKPNHLALVKKGRVSGAYVYDENNVNNENNGAKKMFNKIIDAFKKVGLADEDLKDLEELKDEFRESDHPRGKDGKFTSGGGSNSGSSSSAKSEEKEESYAEQAKRMQQGKLKGYEQYIPYMKQVIARTIKNYGHKDEDFLRKMAVANAKSKIETIVSGHGMAYADDIKNYVNKEIDNLKKSKGVGDNADTKEQKMKIEEKDKLTKDADHEDKRKLIDEIGGILKGKIDDELIRTIMQKAEELAYNDSESEEGVEGEEDADIEPVKSTEPEKATEPIEPTEQKTDLQKIKDEAKEEAKKEFAELIKAKKQVEDVCGKIGTQDSKEQYYKIGCERLGIKTEGICDSAFEPMFKGALAVSKKSLKIKSKSDVMDASSDIKEIDFNLPTRKW